MKKIDKNQIVFIIVFLFIVAGFVSKDSLIGLKNAAVQVSQDIKVYGITDAFLRATDNVEKATSDCLLYHDEAININSLFLRVMGTAIVEKDDMTVVKAKNGYLGNPRAKISDEDLLWRAQNVAELENLALQSGAKFIYVMAPTKGYSLNYPSNVEDYTASNCDRFADLLEQKNISFLNLIDIASNEGITDEQMFFATDHHWRPSMGMWASDRVCSALKDWYGFEYSEDIYNKENYSVTTYEDWFLGSQGKKAGKYFSPFGADDIELIVPKFDTSFVEEQPAKEHRREGNFSETLLYTENIEVKDYYSLNPYAAYSGGDFRQQIITNNLNPNGKTVLVIRDSYGCVFTPFLSLSFNKTYVTDIRDGAYIGDKVHLPSYIQAVKPDYVLVLYTGVSAGESLYTFK